MKFRLAAPAFGGDSFYLYLWDVAHRVSLALGIAESCHPVPQLWMKI